MPILLLKFILRRQYLDYKRRIVERLLIDAVERIWKEAVLA
jgi:hypothetical protein